MGPSWQTQALRNVNLMQKVKPQTNALLDEMATLLQVMAGCWVCGRSADIARRCQFCWGPGLLNPNAACVPAGFLFYIDHGRCFSNNESLGNVINFGPRENACLQQILDRCLKRQNHSWQLFPSFPVAAGKVMQSCKVDLKIMSFSMGGVSLDFAWRSHTQVCNAKSRHI